MKNTDGKEKLKPAKGNILVMDDEKIIRDMIEMMLSRLGYRSAVVRDGAEAIEFYQKAKDCGTPYDVVILDLTIPGGMGGSEAIQRLAEIDPNVKGIVTSGGPNGPVINEYKKYGFKSVVVKPFTVDELGEKLTEVMMETYMK